jgi:hypothetical protein
VSRHKRRGAYDVQMRGIAEPFYFLETAEVIAAVAATGAPAHIGHIQGTLGEDAPGGLELIRGLSCLVVAGTLTQNVDSTADLSTFCARAVASGSGVGPGKARRVNAVVKR